MNEKNNWIIGICDTDADGVRILRASGAKEDVKGYLFSLVMEERNEKESCFDFGTESIEDITVGMNGSLYAFNCFFDSHTDYSLWKEMEAVPVGSSESNGYDDTVKGLAMAAYKVYGERGHRQRESFRPSYWYDFSNDTENRIIEIFNSDLTGTNQYTVIRVFMDTHSQCISEIHGQITDGVFENSAVGLYEDVTSEYTLDKVPRMAAEREGD